MFKDISRSSVAHLHFPLLAILFLTLKIIVNKLLEWQ